MKFAKGLTELVRAVRERLSWDRFTRVVIDPITMVRLTIKDELEYRRAFIRLLKEIARYDVTFLITSEIYETNIEDYLVSGVIELRTFDAGGKIVRGIKIVKFRGSSFDETMRPYRITDNGVEVYSEEGIS